MKNAFTMIELVFIIVVAGIITAIALPRFDQSTLLEVADQIVSHIRYTQHLAMQDDKFDPNDRYWYKKRWQLAFHKKTAGADYKWSYTIFSDNNKDGNPNASETAKNPQNPNQLLTGGYSAGIVAYTDKEATKTLNIGHEYGIENIVFSGGCKIKNNRNYRIAFDYIGRPLYDKLNYFDNLYKKGAVIKLILSQCKISLCVTSPCSNTNDYSKRIDIAIEPETGYTHILPKE